MNNSQRMVIHDFLELQPALEFAARLMASGTQFAFCPQPISISHPKLRLRQPEPQPEEPTA